MAHSPSAPKKYTGALAEPIYEPVVRLGWLDEFAGKNARDEILKKVQVRLAEKMRLLLQHYGIDPNDKNPWTLLSFELACAHVPGMQVHFDDPPKRGRKRTWKAGLGEDLVNAVRASVRTGAKDVRHAIAQLIRAEPKTWGRFSTQNLEARYREARREQQKRNRLVRALAGPVPMGGLYGLGAREWSRPLLKYLDIEPSKSKSLSGPVPVSDEK